MSINIPTSQNFICEDVNNTMFVCNECDITFKSIFALNGHKRKHGPSKGKLNVTLEESKSHQMRLARIKKYNSNPKKCNGCQIVLEYDKRNNKFCSRSCSTSHNNKLVEKTQQSKQKTSESLKAYFLNNPKNPNKIKNTKVEGPASRVYFRKCNHCNVLFTSRKRVKYCNAHATLYKSKGKNRYKFVFNVFDYPDLFDLSLIEKYGWFSHGGRYKYNPSGITRDHRVSVNEAIKNDYDPYYITHPINCELMQFEKNNKKKTKSSLTYDELVKLVDEYDMKKSGIRRHVKTN